MALPLEAALQKKIDESERRRSIVLRQIAQGRTIKEAAKAADVHPGTIERWGRRYPEFRKARDEVRAALRNQEQEKAEEVGGVLTHDGTFQSFRKKYFRFDTYYHQQEMVRAIETAPRMEISMVNVAPEHGKTTLLTDYMCYRIALDPNIRITFVSEGQPHAKKVVAHVKERLTRVDLYPDFITRYGPFHIEGSEDASKPWTAQYLTVHNADADERDYCVDDQTEILTEDGWVTHDQLVPGMQILALDTTTGQSQWEPVDDVHRFEARERDMIALDTHGHSSLTTPGHRWWVDHAGENQWRTSETITSDSRIPMAAPHRAPLEQKWDDALVELVAWWWTEGSLQVKSDKNWSLEIGQSHRVNPAYVDRIRAAIRSVFGEPVSGRRDGTGWREYRSEKRGMTMFTLNTHAAKYLTQFAPDKMVDPRWLMQLTQSQLDLYVDTSVAADGWVSKGGQTCVSQNCEDRIRAFEVAAALAGRPYSTSFQANIEMWVTCLYRRGSGYSRPVGAMGKRGASKHAKHDGMVWCPATPSQTWFARRNGTAYFTGNTLEARGIKSAVAGTRADLMLIDDVQSRRSLGQTDSILGALRQDFFTRVGKDGKIIVVGTRAGEQDVYQALIDEDLIARHVELPALDRDGKALCPELWDEESLKIRRKQVGEEVWWRTYQQKPSHDGTKTFSVEAIDRAQDENLTVGAKTLDGEDVYTGRKIVAAIDPALSGGNVLHVAGFNNDDYVLYDIWMSDNIGRVEKILEQIEEAAQLYRFSELVVEVNAFQRGMARDDRLRDMANEYGFQIVEHETGKNKTDAAYGVAQMPTDFRTGAIRIPAADAESQAKFNELCTQLERWRPDLPARILKQDAVMSLWFGWLRWSKTRRFSEASAEQWKKRGAAEALSGFKRRSAAVMAAKKRTDR